MNIHGQDIIDYKGVVDANGDDAINIGDVTKVERIILGYDDPTPGADANGDGIIDMADVTMIEMIILGFV